MLRIFEDFAAGASLIGITNALNEEAIPTFAGAAWSSWTVRNMLLNPAYARDTIYRRTKATYRHDPKSGRRRRVVEVRDPSDWIEVPDATPAIIPEHLFEAVKARLLDPERRRAAQRKYNYALTDRALRRLRECHGGADFAERSTATTAVAAPTPVLATIGVRPGTFAQATSRKQWCASSLLCSLHRNSFSRSSSGDPRPHT